MSSVIRRRGSRLLALVAGGWSAVALGQSGSPGRTFRGYVEDGVTGERLIGATVLDRDVGIGTTSNAYGFFAYGYAGDTLRVTVSYVGYAPLDTVIVGPPAGETVVALAAAATLATAEVSAATQSARPDERVQMSAVDIPVAQIKRAPVLLGETDVLKAMQLLPGVAGGTEGTAGLYVRGGSPDQNLVLLDGVPVYNVSHVLGLFSVFNADALGSVTLTKGGFPARYGGRLSSVVEVNLRDGNAERWRGEGAVGLLMSRLTLDGPVGDRTRVLVSGRRSYLDLVAKPFVALANRLNADGERVRPRQHFYDLNLKVRHTLDDRNALYASGYLGGDVFGSRVDAAGDSTDYSRFDGGTRWGNRIASLRWAREVGRRAFANLTASYSRYEIGFDNAYEELDGADFERYESVYRSGIEDWALRYDLALAPDPRHAVRVGAGATHHTYRPGATQLAYESPEVESLDTVLGRDPTRGVEAYAYVEDEWRLSPKLAVNAGVHASGFAAEGRTYGSVQPRLALRYRTDGGLAYKASFATMAQYVNLLSSEALSLPTDLWVPATARIRPQRAWQAAAGVARTWRDAYELSAEAFYKEMDGVVSYRPGASFAGFRPGDSWEDLVVQGEGRVYGVELFAQRKLGRTTGWVGYTLSWNDRRFAEIAAGERFPFRYDRRHDVSVLASHRVNERVTLSGAWTYATGNAYTLPRYSVATDYRRLTQPGYGSGWDPRRLEQATGKNDYRMSASHRLDLSVSLTKRKRWGERTIVWGVYNAYWHRNPVYVAPADREGPGGQERRVYVEYSLLPLIPSFSYQFTF